MAYLPLFISSVNIGSFLGSTNVYCTTWLTIHVIEKRQKLLPQCGRSSKSLGMYKQFELNSKPQSTNKFNVNKSFVLIKQQIQLSYPLLHHFYTYLSHLPQLMSTPIQISKQSLSVRLLEGNNKGFCLAFKWVQNLKRSSRISIKRLQRLFQSFESS